MKRKLNRLLIYWLAIGFILIHPRCSPVKSTGSSINSSIKEWKSLFNGKDIRDWTLKVNHHPDSFKSKQG